jgi:hypothetical protein
MESERGAGPGRAIRLLLIALAAALPALASSTLVRHELGAAWADYAPEGQADLRGPHGLFWSDELDNWHEIATFARHGFAGGYYTYDERPPPVPGLRFGPHGPVFPVLYGLLGRLVGWHAGSGPIFNAVLLGLAVLAFGGLARPDTRQRLGLCLVLLVCWPMLLFLPSTMQESFHHAVALVLAGAFAAWSRRSGQVRPGWRWALFGGVALASLCRPTWCFVLLPFMLTGAPGGRGARGILVRYGLACALAFLGGRLLAAPYPYWFVSDFFALLRHAPGRATLELLAHAASNLQRWFDPRVDDPLVVVQRYQLLLLLGFGLVGAWASRRGERSLARVDGEALLHLANLGLPLLFVTVAYDTYFYRDYRLLAPHVLLSSLVLVVRRRARLLGVVVLASLLVLPGFLRTFRQLHARHFVDEAVVMQDFASNLSRFVAYRPGADPWCNSLLADASLFPFLKTVPVGIGIGVTMNWRAVARPLRSKYLLVGPERSSPFDGDQVRLLAAFPARLYLNLQARCEAR